MNWRTFISSLTLVALIWSCAKQTTPTGGPKDETAPKLVRSTPSNKQTNVSKTEIELTFDEAIQVNNAREQIIIVPPVGKKFEATARKNRLTLKLNAELQGNTTYSINFREAVEDLTEKNPAENLKLAFSTGAYVDSLSVQGIVYDLLKGKKSSGFTVAIAPQNDTFSIFKHPAQYFTITNKEGGFIIENLKSGKYSIYAFEDRNKNLIADSKTESYGFLTDTLSLDSVVRDVEIPVLRLDMRELKLISAKPFSNHFLIRTSKGLTSYLLSSREENQSLVYDQPDHTSVRVYNTLQDRDSIPVHFMGADSIENKLDTLFFLKFNAGSEATQDKFTVKVDKLNFVVSKQELRGSISLTKPFLQFVYDSICIRLDSVNQIAFTRDDFTWNQTFTRATLFKKVPSGVDFKAPPRKPVPRKPNESGAGRRVGTREENKAPTEPVKPDLTKIYNQLIIPPGTIISIEHDTAATILNPIGIIKPEASSIILTEVQAPENVITELTDEKGNTLERSTSKKSKFENLLPGNYMIRVIIDSNSNGKWDPGNYIKRIEPELVLFYRGDLENPIINIKANWELGPLLIKH